MKMLRALAGALLLAWSAAPVLAQSATATVAGQVTDRATGQPLSGVEIQVVGTAARGLTDEQGRYLLTRVPAGEQTIRAMMLGYAPARQTVTVAGSGTATANFALETSAIEVEGIVVTALGMERQARTLGVATEQLQSEELTRAEVNLVNTLSGQVAGVHITNSGPQGGSSRIVIRGESSITGENQPLFIVDGIPVDNSTGYGQVLGTLSDQGGFDYGNAIQDISPENIESITVLKGPNAAALYGSRAANGAIIIETKKGRAASGEIVASQLVSFEDELRLPNYQNVYGQGLSGRFEYYDGFGNGVYDEVDESWGPPLDVGLMIPQWDSPLDPETGERVATPWVSRPDNVDQFFDVGTTLTTNVAVSGSNDRLNGRLSLSRTQLDGMLPGFEMERTSLTFAGGVGVTDRLRVNTSAQYITSDGENRPGTGYGEDNPMSQFIWFGRQVDTRELERRYNEVRPEGDPMAGLPYSWNTLYHPNPYFLQLTNRNSDSRDRLIGQVSAEYRFNEWLSGLVRTGTDWYQDGRLKSYAYNPQIELSGYYTTNPVTAGREYLTNNGGFGEWEIGFQETNTEFLLNASPDLRLPFTTAFMFGGNRRDVEQNYDYTWVGELATPGIFDVSNAAGTPSRNTFLARQRVNSLFGQAELGYRDYLFLTVTGRNDWSSTLPEDNRSYFYPSVSGSFVFSDVVPAVQQLFSYGKLRASWARVGNDTNPYSLRNTFIADEIWEGRPSFTVPGQLANSELKPETTESIEVGTELAFFDNRLGLDVTYYTAETRDQIMPVQLSRGTGYVSRLINAGVVENKGWEVLVRGTPVRRDRFGWETTLTWAKNDNEVVSLAEGVDGLQLGLGDFWGVSLYAREGEPLGQLVGPGYQRDPDGNILVDAEGGFPLATTAPLVLGNVNPDWRASWSNEFSFGPARLRVLLDGKMGGDIFSVTNMFGRYAGVLEETLEGRCTPAGDVPAGGSPPPGYPICTPETGIVVDGVNRVISGSDTTYVPNQTVIDAQTYWSYMYGVKEAHVEDGSYVKLRDVTLSYTLPSSFAGRLGMDAVEVALIGRNLWLWSKAEHLDPETSMEASNQQGFEYGQMPSPRSFGFNIIVRP